MFEKMFEELTWFKLYLHSSIALDLLDHLPTTANYNSHRVAGHSYLQNYKQKKRVITAQSGGVSLIN